MSIFLNILIFALNILIFLAFEKIGPSNFWLFCTSASLNRHFRPLLESLNTFLTFLPAIATERNRQCERANTEHVCLQFSGPCSMPGLTGSKLVQVGLFTFIKVLNRHISVFTSRKILNESIRSLYYNGFSDWWSNTTESVRVLRYILRKTVYFFQTLYFQFYIELKWHEIMR